MKFRIRLPRFRIFSGLRERLGASGAGWSARFEPMLARWRGLQPRQRAVYGTAAAVLAVLLFYALLWLPLYSSIAHLREVVPKDRERLALMHAQAQEAAQLRASGAKIARGGNIMATLEQAANARGLRQNVARMEPEGRNGALITLQAVHFNALLGMLHDLQTRSGFRVESASFESQAEPGHVNARLTLRAPAG